MRQHCQSKCYFREKGDRVEIKRLQLHWPLVLEGSSMPERLSSRICKVSINALVVVVIMLMAMADNMKKNKNNRGKNKDQH